MAQRTVLNDNYKGLVESVSIPAVVEERDGKKFARSGSVVPIHCSTPDEISAYAPKTHHYCDVFTEQVLAPLEELAFVRLDQNTAEKVFINRKKRILLTSSDGALAQWRCAPTFESSNQYVAGAPIVNKEGALISVVTARVGNHYAVSSFEGDGGYFETPQPWKILDSSTGLIYGDRVFPTHEALKDFIATLGPAALDPDRPPTPVLVRGANPRVAFITKEGRQIAHNYLQGVISKGVEYL
ncbi:hypothetical protein JYU34_011761 [Plutella xylostella]|uniref:Uncharacterized protein n=1 Tax=Plutella xylostella TaxID=51655 RepID=A0ABQ7QEU0_PLUXY|nr:hypothetical protein JYU34_011761 [Plutella xylostella]